MDNHFSVSPYLVITRGFGLLRAHLSVLHDRSSSTHSKDHPFLGFDKTLENGIVVMADPTAGKDSFSSFGVG